MDRRAVERLQSVNDFDSLLPYLRDELDWPVEDYGFDDLTFQYTAQELGLDDRSAAKVTAIRRLRPLDAEQPWGIFFLELEPKRLPVVALRRVLSKMTLKKRASSNRSDSPAWHADDILFISRTGESDERHLTFAHFAANPEKADLPVLKVLGWDASDTVLRVDQVAEVLKEKLVWPADPSDSDLWRKQWRDAFTLKHRQQVTTAKEMASRLAELARSIRGAIREVLTVESENGPLTKIMDAFRESLVHDLDPEQFADTYAQTITYGLLSARITDPSKNTLDDLSSHMQTNPFLKELMESFILVGGRKRDQEGVGLDFDELGVSDVIELLDNANMEAVVRDFGKHNQQEDPVIHFFEGFLQEYDRSIRKDRGVFYTPRPVVSFIVRSVDELLRTEFGLEDGLADTTTWGEMAGRIDDLEIPEGATATEAFVQILDPATGTGTFLVEVIDLIHKTMTAKWQAEGHGKEKIQELWKAYVPERLLPRLHGYELMMAPYAIAHMKIGLKLYETGYRFESDERARVYLTNALEPAQDFSGTLAFAIPALAHEAEAVNAIKRYQRFTVVIGNPPYSGRSWNLSPELRKIVEPYRYVEGVKIQEKGALQLEKSIQEDYIKFVRNAQVALEQAGVGALGFVTSHGFLDNPTLRGMRSSFLEAFQHLNIIDMHGNVSRGDECPDGTADENVFDIKKTGVAISISSRHPRLGDSRVLVSDLWGDRDKKYGWLSANTAATSKSTVVEPTAPQFLFVVENLEAKEEYERGYSVEKILPLYSKGVVTGRDAFVSDFDSAPLLSRMADFVDSTFSDAELVNQYKLNPTDWWNVQDARRKMPPVEQHEDFLRTMLYRPFDARVCFYHPSVFMSPRRPVMKQQGPNGKNLFLITSRMTKGETFAHVTVSDGLAEAILLSSKTSNNAIVFPLYLGTDSSAESALELDLNEGHRTAFAEFFIRDAAEATNMQFLQEPRGDLKSTFGSENLFNYIFSILHSPTFRARYREFLKRDFPRIPLPGCRKLFAGLSSLGEKLVALQLLKSHVLDDQVATQVGSGEFQVEQASYSDETVWIDKAKTRGFEGVPEEVWNFHIGGYQVCEKWLKDRQAKGGKNPRPGRVLTDEDVEHYQKIVVALSETIRIMAEIDEVIEAHGGWPGAFQMGDAGDQPVSDVIYAKADDDDTQLDMVADRKDG